MCRLIRLFLAAFLAVELIWGSSMAMSRGSLLDEWTEVMRRKGWVTADADTSRPDLVPVPIDRIVVKVGGQERVAYQAQPGDLQIGRPIVSPDGTRVAFPKTEDAGRYGAGHRKIYVMNVDGSNLKPLVELRAVFPIKGALTGEQVAWSHDDRSLVLIGTLRGAWPGEADSAPARLGPAPPKDGQETGAPRSLIRVDVSTGQTTELVKFGRSIFGDYRGPSVTSQAWAPDDQRLAYSTKEGRVIITDTANGSQVDVGPGEVPTWSPDGRFIAVQGPRDIKKGWKGDFFTISAEPPYERTLLLSNTRPIFPSWGGYYYGPVLWFPDTRFLMVMYVPPDAGRPYLLDRKTGRVVKLPEGYHVHSWGGKP